MAINNNYQMGFQGSTLSYMPVGNYSLQIRTIEMFVKSDNVSSRSIILHYGTTSTSSRSSAFFLEVNNNKFSITVGNGSTFVILNSSMTILPNVMYHLAVVTNGSRISMYINGVLDNYINSTINPLSTNQILTVGKSIVTGYELPFKGSLDEIRLWSDDRTSQEIAQYHDIYSSDLTMDNLEFYYRFEDGSNTTAIDSSGNNRNATLTGTVVQPALVDLVFLSKTLIKSNSQYYYYDDISDIWIPLSGIPSDVDWEAKGIDSLTRDSLLALKNQNIVGKVAIKNI